MPSYHVTATIQMTYEIEASNEEEATLTYLDGNIIWDRMLEFDVEEVCPECGSSEELSHMNHNTPVCEDCCEDCRNDKNIGPNFVIPLESENA